MILFFLIRLKTPKFFLYPYSALVFKILTASFVSGVLCGFLDVHERAGAEHHPAGRGEPTPPHRGHLQAKPQNIISNIVSKHLLDFYSVLQIRILYFFG
jgi:hypothetical protein